MWLFIVGKFEALAKVSGDTIGNLMDVVIGESLWRGESDLFTYIWSLHIFDER